MKLVKRIQFVLKRTSVTVLRGLAKMRLGAVTPVIEDGAFDFVILSNFAYSTEHKNNVQAPSVWRKFTAEAKNKLKPPFAPEKHPR